MQQKGRDFSCGSKRDEWDAPDEEIRKVAKKFVLANCYDHKIASLRFE
jgi:putative transposase